MKMDRMAAPETEMDRTAAPEVKMDRLASSETKMDRGQVRRHLRTSRQLRRPSSCL